MLTSKRIHIPTDAQYIDHLNELMPPGYYGFGVDFSAYRELFSQLELDCPIDYFDTISDREARAKATQLIYSTAWDKIIKNDAVKARMNSILISLWEYLAKEDEPARSAAIFAPGGKIIWRRGDAILSLLNKGLAEKVICSGSQPFLASSENPNEASTLMSYLVERGIEPERILVENRSRSTTENVYFSFELLKEMGELPESLILVANPMQMLRLYLTFKALGPKLKWSPSLYRVPIEIHVNKNNYFEDFDEFCLLLSEYTKTYYSFCQDSK